MVLPHPDPGEAILADVGMDAATDRAPARAFSNREFVDRYVADPTSVSIGYWFSQIYFAFDSLHVSSLAAGHDAQARVRTET